MNFFLKKAGRVLQSLDLVIVLVLLPLYFEVQLQFYHRFLNFVILSFTIYNSTQFCLNKIMLTYEYK